MSQVTEHVVYHFTHVSHLPAIVRDGLLSDSAMNASGSLMHEAGDRGIKDQRRRRVVPCGHCGVVADYVPFYFAPRSPMLYRITNPHGLAGGGVTTYDGAADELVYLVTSVERLYQAGLSLVLTDRNAATSVARFQCDAATWFEPEFIDWPLMSAQLWHDTTEYPDRMARRMAECLAHQRVPWALFVKVAVANAAVAQEAHDALSSAGEHEMTTVLAPSWYF